VSVAFLAIIEESGITRNGVIFLIGYCLEAVMIVFLCAHCGQKLQVPKSFAGKPVRCSICKHVMNSPAPLAVAVADKAALPEITGQPSSLAQAGLGGGVTLGESGPSETDESKKGSSSHRALREALARGPAGGERYRVLNEIARGGMGAVLRAADCDVRREVAVKYLLDQADERKKARFVEEAQITGQLEHPNIVPIHELGVDAKKRLFFSMKMVRGRSLQQVLADLRDYPRSAEKEYSLSRLLGIFVNVCHALAYAHSRGVVHRDLKPANIMIGDFGEVYVMDWGLAKVVSRDSARSQAEHGNASSPAAVQATVMPSFTWAETPNETSARVKTSRDAADDQTVDGTIMGTPLYMPPEQANGNIAAIDQRSDVYSLGALLYEALTLQPPVEREGGHMAILMRVSQGEIIPPALRAPQRARAGKIPKELAAVAMKALAKNPDDRYQDVSDLRRDIELFQEGRSVSAKEDTKWESLLKFVRRNKGFSLAAAVAAILLAVVLIGSSWVNYQARVRAEKAYAAYLQEQEEKHQQAKKSVPAFVDAAHVAVERKRFGDALAQVNIALDYDPDNGPARLLKGQLLIARKEFAAARQELERYLRAHPDDAQSASLARLCARGKVDDPALNADLADILIRQQMSSLAEGLLQAPEKLLNVHRAKIERAWRGLGQRLSMDADGQLALNLDNCPQVLDLFPIRNMPLRTLILHNSQVRDLSPLQGMQLTSLSINNCPRITNLTPLKGMKLTSLTVQNWGEGSDFSALKGMRLTKLILYSTRLRSTDLGYLHDAPLTELSLAYCGELTHLGALKGKRLNSLQITACPKLKDLTALQGMPLTTLMLDGCSLISDLKPLKGMPLTQLSIGHSSISDLSPLEGMRLTQLTLIDCPQIKDLTPLQGMPLTTLMLDSCGSISDLKLLASMPLTQLNIGHSSISDLSPLEGKRLTQLTLVDCPQIKDLKPLRGMPLTTLMLDSCRLISDLRPLEGMRLIQLDIRRCSITDLSPVTGMRLTQLVLHDCSQIKDLKPLRGMPLTTLEICRCDRIKDLTPLAGLPLNSVNLVGCTELEDLAIFKDMPLTALQLQDCRKVKDLKPLRGTALSLLRLTGCNQITDLSPLAEAKLDAIWFDPRIVKKGVDDLRKIGRLATINDLPAVDFWKQYDAGAFKE
jgi:serine/threonine protein kinase/Leucine-rich repeat (LRR) protein